MKQIQVIVIAFLHLEYKQISSINRAGNTLFYTLDTLARKYLPCLGQGGKKTYAVQRQAPAHIYTPGPPSPVTLAKIVCVTKNSNEGSQKSNKGRLKTRNGSSGVSYVRRRCMRHRRRS